MEELLASELFEALLLVAAGALVTTVAGLAGFAAKWYRGRKERRLSLRRDVYLDAIAAIGEQQRQIGRFNWPDFDRADLLLDSGPLSRVQLVGSRQTVEALETLNLETISQLFLLSKIWSRVNQHREQIASAREEREDLMKSRRALKDLQLDIPFGSEHEAKILSFLERAEARFKEIDARVAKLRSLEHQDSQDLANSVRHAVLECQELTATVVTEMRRELELPTGDWLHSIADDRTKAVTQILDGSQDQPT